MKRLKISSLPKTTKFHAAPADGGGNTEIDPLALEEAKKIDEYRVRANAGDAEAQSRLGYFYFYGVGIAQDQAEGVKWFIKAAEQGYLKAQKNLVVCYSQGLGVTEDGEEALKWMIAAAEQGDLEIQLNLANIYDELSEDSLKPCDNPMLSFHECSKEHFEEELLRDNPDPITGEMPKGESHDNIFSDFPKKSGATPKEDSEDFNPKATLADGNHSSDDEILSPFDESLDDPFTNENVFTEQQKKDMEDGFEILDFGPLTTDPNAVEAVKWYKRAAEQGSIKAKGQLGLHYLFGEGTHRNTKKAIPLLLEAAEHGHLESQVILADEYFHGLSLPQNFREALKWYHAAAKNGDPRCQETFGRLRIENRRNQKDLEEGIQWLEIAMKNGNVNAMEDLAVLYDERDGNPEKAAKYYEMAAERGHRDAQFTMGQCYRWGDGVPVDLQKAAFWYRKAAEQNVAEAQFNLGQCYHNGHGVEQDDVQSVYWLTQAASHEMPQALHHLGLHYLHGVGVEKNVKIGLILLRKAFDKGIKEAIMPYLAFKGVLHLKRDNMD